MRVLITGGAGYLGGWAVSHALRRGHEVRVLDRFCFSPPGLQPEQMFQTELRSGQLTLWVGDIRRLQEVTGIFNDVDAVLHLASLSSDPTCDLDTEMAHEVNVECTKELARQALESGARRFVFASTCAVYGHGVFEFLDEESPANPVSVFSKTKLEAESLLLAMQSPTFCPVVARLSTLYGYSKRMRFDLAVNHMVATAVRKRRILVRGGGNQWRPFIHVQDAAAALLHLLETDESRVKGEIFNIGQDEQNIRVYELAQLVGQTLGNVEIEVAKDDDDLRNYRVQFKKIVNRVGFQCTFTIPDGIQEIRHFLDDSDINPFEEQFFNVDRMKRLRATPVDEGGEPVAARFIPLARPSIGKEEEQAVVEALRSGWLTSGPHVKTFENMFAQEVGAPYAVAVSSCTAALHLCLADLNLGAGDEVITSPITWASTGNTIINMGATIRFVDVDPLTMNLDPEKLEDAITDRTRAIIPVHMAGHPCDMDRIRTIAAKYTIPVIEDAAHALGAVYKGRPIGADGPCCFSFYAIKNITTMEGGMITLNDEEVAVRLRILASNGLAATAWDRYGRSAAATPPEVIVPGYKYAMGNVHAAMGIEQLKKYHTFKAARCRIADLYRSVLSSIEEIEIPSVSPEVEHAWHLFIIKLKLERLSRTRNELMQELRKENIGTGIHFYGLHLHHYYREKLGMWPEQFPVATELSQRIISLPLYPQLTDKHIHEVVSALKKVLACRRK